MSYLTLAFSDAAKRIQQKMGSRAGYARMENQTNQDELSPNEAEFIALRDGFYMATVGENGFPYIQFRGGPKGFLKVLDATTLGFIDFSGNRQYISVGNLATNSKVSLFLMDYPAQARLKIFAEAEVVELKDNPQLAEKLRIENYQHKPERMILLHLKGFNWNCTQHITPRYTMEEIEEVFTGQQAYISKLEEEIKTLKADRNKKIG